MPTLSAATRSPTLDRFVVVDVETTGVYNNDRVVEVAAVSVDLNGRIIDEWDTLVDPQRDVGPTWLHGVTATMITNAPTFEEIGGALAARLNGAVMVGHNLSFDARFIGNEYARVGGLAETGRGVDTMRVMGGKLSDVCSRLGVVLSEHHRALADARATAQVLINCFEKVDVRDIAPSRVEHQLPTKPRTLRREATRPPNPSELKPPFLGYLGSRLTHEGVGAQALAYIELLDWALADLVLDSEERSQLRFLAHALGFSDSQVEVIHQSYMDELVAAAERDGVITDAEHDQLTRAAEALGVAWVPDKPKTSLQGQPDSKAGLVAGMTVCFTGDAGIKRADLEDVARGMGLEPIGNVTKKCSLLVAADPNTRSGKAANARKYGVQVLSVDEFMSRARRASPR